MEGGKSNNGASKNKSSVSLETSQNSTCWKEAFLKALESPHFCIVSMENEITPSLALKRFSSDFTPGSQICQGPAGHCRVWWLMASEKQEKGKRAKTGFRQSLKSNIWNSTSGHEGEARKLMITEESCLGPWFFPLRNNLVNFLVMETC